MTECISGTNLGFKPTPCTAGLEARRCGPPWSNARAAAIDQRGVRGERAGRLAVLHLYRWADARLVVSLLRKMMRCGAKSTQLFVDELPTHKTALIKAYVEATNGMLARHFLPGYEPELNPDELMWSHVKRTEMVTAQLRRGEELQDKIMARFATIRRLPSPVRSFFLAPNVAYIAYG